MKPEDESWEQKAERAIYETIRILRDGFKSSIEQLALSTRCEGRRRFS